MNKKLTSSTKDRKNIVKTATNGNLQSIPVMMEEYKTLRNELMTVHSRQQYNVIQGLVVIGALIYFVANNWSNVYNDLVFFTLIVAMPLCCYTIILTAASTFARGRQIGQYLFHIELKVSYALRHETHNFSNNHESLNFMNWYFHDNKEKGRFILRFDLATMMGFFFLLVLCSIYLGCKYISFDIGKLWPFLLINAIFFIAYLFFVMLAFKYVKDSSEKNLQTEYKDVR